jgi:5-methyltetrahydrofolate corrinoid/iron sulfur protein methyltransferase
MILVAENVNVMSATIGPAMNEKNAQPIQQLAKAVAETGIDYIDLNIGPARKTGVELMPWLVETVQQVSDKKLALG